MVKLHEDAKFCISAYLRIYWNIY